MINKGLFSKFKIFYENTFIGNDSSYYKKNESYHFLTQSKINLSFGSTMIVEGVSNDNICYYIDPNLENSTFFHGLNHLNSLRISSYEQLEKLVLKKISENIVDNILNKNEICLKSEDVSNRIFEHLQS